MEVRAGPGSELKEHRGGNESYCLSNSPLEVRFNTVNPACLARETESGAESFGEFTGWGVTRRTAWPQVEQVARSGAPAACAHSKPSPQRRQGDLSGA